MLDGPASGIHTRLGLIGSTVVKPSVLRYCPACHAEALAHWGERFWRRTHQLPGVLVCLDHGVPLIESKTIPSNGHNSFYIAADSCADQAEPPTPAWANDDACQAILLDLTRRSAAVLDAMPRGVDRTDLIVEYRLALRDRRVASANGRVDQRRLHDAFDTLFAPACSVLPELANTAWLSPIVHNNQRASHPLHHILFELFLDRYAPVPPSARRPYRRQVETTESANQLRDMVNQGKSLGAIARTLGVGRTTVRRNLAKLGLALFRPPRPAEEDPGPAIRERWLEHQRREPHLKRIELIRRLWREYKWLYRHDRTWLNAHSPTSAVRSPPVSRQDWRAIDHNLAADLRNAAEDIVRLAPPLRVTLAELERRVRSPGWINNRRHKLPQTMTMLAEVRESVEDFQLRRIAWARAVLEQSGESTSPWKVRCLARVPRRVSEVVNLALASTRCRSESDISDTAALKH